MHTRPRPLPDRRRLLAAIHAEAAKLRMEEEDRRALQVRLTGHASCADMGIAQLRSVLAALRSLLGKPQPKRPADDRARLLWRLEADLKRAGYPYPAYALGISQRMWGATAPARLEWHTPRQLHALVAALAYDGKRKRRPQPGPERA